MISRPILRLGLTLPLLVLAACGPRTTPEQRLEKLRLQHEIIPLGANTVHDQAGEPTLLVDLQVANHGARNLSHLTVMVRVRTPDGAEKVARRIGLDMSTVRPGVGVQMAATLPGVAMEEGDEVTVEIESGLDPAILHSLAEWADVTSG